MKTSMISLVGIGSMILAGTASAGYSGLTAEVSSQSGVGGFGPYDLEVVQVYANFTDENDKLTSMYGDGDNQLLLQTSAASGFYQNTLGGNTSKQINPFLFGSFASVEYDTFLTIGATDQTGDQLLEVGLDWSSFGTSLQSNNGALTVTPDDAQAAAGSDLKVLIGQFSFAAGEGGLDSMEGSVVNLVGKNADGSTWSATQQWIPAPGALALLGLAGLAGRRRRRSN